MSNYIYGIVFVMFGYFGFMTYYNIINLKIEKNSLYFQRYVQPGIIKINDLASAQISSNYSNGLKARDLINNTNIEYEGLVFNLVGPNGSKVNVIVPKKDYLDKCLLLYMSGFDGQDDMYYGYKDNSKFLKGLLYQPFSLTLGSLYYSGDKDEGYVYKFSQKDGGYVKYCHFVNNDTDPLLSYCSR